jgi:hypothetical protein
MGSVQYVVSPAMHVSHRLPGQDLVVHAILSHDSGLPGTRVARYS